MNGVDQLGRDVLKAVSRSFYLTLRVLPSGFREPASLGYLLARLSDTIADAGNVPITRRRELLERFRVALSAPKKGPDGLHFARELPGLLEEAGLERGEWDLVLRAADCFEWLERLDRPLSRHVRRVVSTITEGQAWDLTRFDGDDVVRLETAEELDWYTYHVAGCVGEFWTEIGFSCAPPYSESTPKQLLEWGANYGKGLQLVNILRDLPEDLERKRCYLPGESESGPENLLCEAAEWRQRARRYLVDGLRYTESLRGVRLQLATGLPALLGLRTLDLLDEADWDGLEGRVKVSRGVVRSCLGRGLAASIPGLPGSWKAIRLRAERADG